MAFYSPWIFSPGIILTSHFEGPLKYHLLHHSRRRDRHYRAFTRFERNCNTVERLHPISCRFTQHGHATQPVAIFLPRLLVAPLNAFSKAGNIRTTLAMVSVTTGVALLNTQMRHLKIPKVQTARALHRSASRSSKHALAVIRSTLCTYCTLIEVAWES